METTSSTDDVPASAVELSISDILKSRKTSEIKYKGQVVGTISEQDEKVTMTFDPETIAANDCTTAAGVALEAIFRECPDFQKHNVSRPAYPATNPKQSLVYYLDIPNGDAVFVITGKGVLQAVKRGLGLHAFNILSENAEEAVHYHAQKSAADLAREIGDDDEDKRLPVGTKKGKKGGKAKPRKSAPKEHPYVLAFLDDSKDADPFWLGAFATLSIVITEISNTWDEMSLSYSATNFGAILMTLLKRMGCLKPRNGEEDPNQGATKKMPTMLEIAARDRCMFIDRVLGHFMKNRDNLASSVAQLPRVTYNDGMTTLDNLHILEVFDHFPEAKDVAAATSRTQISPSRLHVYQVEPSDHMAAHSKPPIIPSAVDWLENAVMLINAVNCGFGSTVVEGIRNVISAYETYKACQITQNEMLYRTLKAYDFTTFVVTDETLNWAVFPLVKPGYLNTTSTESHQALASVMQSLSCGVANLQVESTLEANCLNTVKDNNLLLNLRNTAMGVRLYYLPIEILQRKVLRQLMTKNTMDFSQILTKTQTCREVVNMMASIEGEIQRNTYLFATFATVAVENAMTAVNLMHRIKHDEEGDTLIQAVQSQISLNLRARCPPLALYFANNCDNLAAISTTTPVYDTVRQTVVNCMSDRLAGRNVAIPHELQSVVGDMMDQLNQRLSTYFADHGRQDVQPKGE